MAVAHALVAALDDGSLAVREAVAAGLADRREPAISAALIERCRDPAADVRRSVMAALVRSEGAAEALLSGLADADWLVREEAAASLGKTAITAAVPALAAALEDAAWQVRVKAAGALGKLRAAAEIPALGRAPASDISNLRKEIASALGEIASPEAWPYLRAVGEDPHPDVRKILRRAITRCETAAKR